MIRSRSESWADKYNTQLTEDQEQQFQRAREADPRLRRDLEDYDVRGLFRECGGDLSKGHWKDRYKKPNHPTFSDESKYHGTDGYYGGHWSRNSGTGKWQYNASATNLRMHNLN